MLWPAHMKTTLIPLNSLSRLRVLRAAAVTETLPLESGFCLLLLRSWSDYREEKRRTGIFSHRLFWSRELALPACQKSKYWLKSSSFYHLFFFRVDLFAYHDVWKWKSMYINVWISFMAANWYLWRGQKREEVHQNDWTKKTAEREKEAKNDSFSSPFMGQWARGKHYL